MTILALIIGVILGAALALVLLRRARDGDDELIGRFEAELRSLEAERARLAADLRGRTAQLGEEIGRVATQTQTLASALRRPGVRGRWGENTLRNVVEGCGLAEHCDYDTQAHVRGADGAIRPDMVISLPRGGTIVADAKVPLDAYLDASECGDPDRAAELLDAHVRQVRAKVTELAAKAYWRQFRRAPEMVVMFVASESALAAAAQRDPKLLADAAAQRVVIASPTTLTALLQVVALGWREEAMAEHAEQVARLSRELCQRLGTFASHLTGTGKGLEAAVRAHNSAVGSFESRLMPTVRRIAESGVGESERVEAPAAVEGAPRLADDYGIADVATEGVHSLRSIKSG